MQTKNQHKAIIKMNIQNFETDFSNSKTSDTAISKEYNNEAQNSESEAVNVVVEGLIKKKENMIELKYMEPDSFDMGKQLTTLSFDENNPDIITIFRNGICSTVLVFELGKRYVCRYSAFGADFEFTTNTFNLSNTLNFENGGDIRLCYTMENGGMTVSTVKMYISVEIEK